MFSGIVEACGRVESLDRTVRGARLAIRIPATLGRIHSGESLAVNGVCLTALKTSRVFCADLSLETLRRTTLGTLEAGDRINLERALRVSDRMSGHIVCGHVDAVVEVRGARREGGGRLFTFSLPASLRRLVVEKGSVAVDGISLTAIGVRRSSFSAAVISHTLRRTTLSERKTGDRVNFEADILSKLVAAQLAR
jgi:riboflavin synthase